MKRLVILLLTYVFSASVWTLPPQMEADRLLLQAKKHWTPTILIMPL
jgi:hypothetical protein